MQFSSLFRRQKSPSTPAAAAAALVTRAMMAPDPTVFPGLTEDQLQSISKLIQITNVAIVLHWLRLLDQGLSDPEKSRARAILQEFERSTLSAAPAEEEAQARELQRLTNQLTRLQEIVKNRKMQPPEYTRRTLIWSREWLAPVFDSEDALDRASQVDGPPLIAHIQQSMKDLAQQVEQIVLQQAME
jgi:hypothetical protein